ncbi:30S ribosomal protein S20 [Leucothrix pacifica]|uniref:Small ribosomal subunit protein bS20 n=1 Tax=Leucothrix pacifica TaxID=1247513 RepID=A0A317CRP4_9GAMM|nr:30S ribosomal protein S20 [Leucothrix pacifica]PWQ99100.1 30S ribosomal protein S20 [Leucothrix pacifica]
MPNIKSAKKRVRLSEERRVHKKHYTTGMRTLIKRVVTAIEAGDKETATEAYTAAVPAIDAGVTKGLIHKNKAARHKSRLNSRIRAL